MKIQEKIIKNYPLINKIDCGLNCYLLAKKRYLIFWHSLIKKEEINDTLSQLEKATNTKIFDKVKTLIVIGRTTDEFKKEELVYFNNSDTFVVFYLINENSNDIYTNNSWIFALGLNYKKFIKKIDKILNN